MRIIKKPRKTLSAKERNDAMYEELLRTITEPDSPISGDQRLRDIGGAVRIPEAQQRSMKDRARREDVWLIWLSEEMMRMTVNEVMFYHETILPGCGSTEPGEYAVSATAFLWGLFSEPRDLHNTLTANGQVKHYVERYRSIGMDIGHSRDLNSEHKVFRDTIKDAEISDTQLRKMATKLDLHHHNNPALNQRMAEAQAWAEAEGLIEIVNGN
jgi:hypothetical protein